MQSSKPFELNKRLHLHLLVIQAASILLFSPELASWMLGLIGLSFLWQLTQLLSNSTNTPRLLLIALALGGGALIAVNSRSLGLLNSMIHLICFAYAIKSMEIRRPRDFYQLVLIGVFLQACSLIFVQSLWFSLLVVALICANLALLYRFIAGQATMSSSVVDTAKLVVLSIPLAIALFVFFPRLSPFWQVPLANSAKTGLGSDVQPGDIANLAQSDELAFRIEFSGPVPPINQMYWRAMTMPFYDGRKWSRAGRTGNANYLLRAPRISNMQGLRYDYQVMAEPSYRHWLFALDTPVSSASHITQLADTSLLNNKPITQTIRYQVSSYPQAQRTKDASERYLAFHRYLPEDSNPRLTELGQELGQRFAEPQQIIDFVLSEYRNQLFYYTLQPPLLSNNSLDQFYFNTKQGFCEHYASTFAFIMRAAGIPSRLVAGYLGGQYNEQGNYYSVYQSDAHAWVEVWLPERGWVTVDPTSAVSPERVSNSMADILRRERISLAGAFSWASFTSSDFMLELRMQIEAIDYQWNRLVVGFSLEKQYQLLTKLFGHGHFWKGMLIIVCVMALTFVFQWLRNQWRKNRKRAAPWRVALEGVFNALEKQGIERGKSQTPQALVPSIKNKLPTLVSDYQLICHLHQKLVYHATTNELEEQLTKQIQHQAKLFKKRLMSLPN